MSKTLLNEAIISLFSKQIRVNCVGKYRFTKTIHYVDTG